MTENMIQTVSEKEWGKDHFDLLAYVETQVVDKKHHGYIDTLQASTVNVKDMSMIGQLDPRRIRVNPQKHPLLRVNSVGPGEISDGKWQYGTRLKGYSQDKSRQVPEHDDIDCLDDLEAAGLVVIISLANLYVALTDKGIKVAAKIREFKACGGTYSQFSI